MSKWIPVPIGKKIIKSFEILTSMETDIVYIYNHGFYDSNNSINLLRMLIKKELKYNYFNYRVNEVINYIKDSTRLKISPSHNPPYISLENCNLNIETLEQEKHSPDKFLTNRIPVKYNPKTDTSKWVKYVNSLVPSEEEVATIQEYTGYVFVSHQKAKKLVYLNGPEDSGKSAFLDILLEFYGTENCSNLSLHQLCEKFTNAELFGKLANIRADMDYKMEPKSVNLIKSLTGDDKITVQRKFKDPFSFHNKAKIFLSANGVPALPVHGVDKAFYSRWIPIKYPNIFKGENRDVSIREKFTTPEEKSAILNWALEGLVRLRENKWRFTSSPSIDEVKDWFEIGMIPTDVEVFLTEITLPLPSGWVEKEELYKVYNVWSKEKGKIALERNAFHRKVKHNRFRQVSEFKPLVDGKQVHAWRGIRLL